MKKLLGITLIIFLVASILVGCNLDSSNLFDGKENNNGESNLNDDQVEEKEGYNLVLQYFNGLPMVSLEDLSSIYYMEWYYDTFEGIIEIRADENTYLMMKDTAIISKNGIYLPNEQKPYIESAESIYIPVEMLSHFDLSYENNQNNEITVFLPEKDNLTNLTAYLDFNEKFPNMNEEELYNYLSFLSLPIEGAHITTRDSQLPGAPRDYRNGTHEGIDWYAGYTGININRTTAVLSMADGIVVRADHEYRELNEEERNEILNASASVDHTPQYILDKLRGRTVWVQYDNGVTVRYAHLSKINEDIKVGKQVRKGDILGYVGNSGTSYGVDGTDIGLHLHSDILIYDHLFWEHLSQEQIRTLLEKLFPY